MPGVGKEDIQVSLDGAVVMLRAEVNQQEVQTKDEPRRVHFDGMTSKFT